MEHPTTVSPAHNTVHVLATFIERARAALEAAIPLAKGSHSRLIVIVTRAVPSAPASEGSADANEDRDGRWIGAPQSVTAWTNTLENRVPYHRAQSIVRLEHRYDNSRGAGGGFLDDGEVPGTAIGLTPTQHLLTVAAIVTFDASRRE